MTRKLFTHGANQELVNSLVNTGARFIIVGSLAVQYYVPSRQVNDLDLLIEQSAETVAKVISVLSSCPLIQHKITVAQLLQPKRIQIPVKIYFNADIITPGADLSFDEHWRDARDARLGSTPVKIGSKGTLLLLLSQSNEPKHVQDIALLKQVTE